METRLHACSDSCVIEWLYNTSCIWIGRVLHSHKVRLLSCRLTGFFAIQPCFSTLIPIIRATTHRDGWRGGGSEQAWRSSFSYQSVQTSAGFSSTHTPITIQSHTHKSNMRASLLNLCGFLQTLASRHSCTVSLQTTDSWHGKSNAYLVKLYMGSLLLKFSFPSSV